MMATDGYNVWIAAEGNLYTTTAGAASASVYIADDDLHRGVVRGPAADGDERA